MLLSFVIYRDRMRLVDVLQSPIEFRSVVNVWKKLQEAICHLIKTVEGWVTSGCSCLNTVVVQQTFDKPRFNL